MEHLTVREALVIAEADLLEAMPFSFGDLWLIRNGEDIEEYWAGKQPFSTSAKVEAARVIAEVSDARRKANRSKSRNKPGKHPRAAWAGRVQSAVNRWELAQTQARRRERLRSRNAK